MTPARPKIYHITHVANLSSIVGQGILSDRTMVQSGGPTQAIGMSQIKQRRIYELGVGCHPGTNVGDYVPFYFCPRSIMLFVIHCANHPELTYRQGQGPIVHLEADLRDVIAWADGQGVPWAFSLSNAGAYYTEFRSDLAQLDQLNWGAIAATSFGDPEVKEGKQAEFLLHGRFPFDLVERIGVLNDTTAAAASAALAGAPHNPPVVVLPSWYY